MNHETQRTRRRNGAEVKALVERYHQSGLSQAEFVRGEGICLVTLSRYLKKTRAVAASPGGEPAGRFIEVEHGGGMRPTEHAGGHLRAPYRVNFGGGASLRILSESRFESRTESRSSLYQEAVMGFLMPCSGRHPRAGVATIGTAFHSPGGL